MYPFNGYCKTVIRFAASNTWRDRSRRRQKEISLEYPISICGHTVILTNGELAAALLSLPEKNREIIFLYFFGHSSKRIRIAAIENGHIDRDTEDSIATIYDNYMVITHE